MACAWLPLTLQRTNSGLRGILSYLVFRRAMPLRACLLYDSFLAGGSLALKDAIQGVCHLLRDSLRTVCPFVGIFLV